MFDLNIMSCKTPAETIAAIIQERDRLVLECDALIEQVNDINSMQRRLSQKSMAELDANVKLARRRRECLRSALEDLYDRMYELFGECPSLHEYYGFTEDEIDPANEK